MKRVARTDIGDFVFVGAAVGALLVALSLAWRLRMFLQGGETISSWTQPLAVVFFLTGLGLAALVAWRPSAILVAAPLAGTAMTLPQMSGLPFVREYGLLVALASGAALVARLAFDPAVRREALDTLSDRAVALLVAYAVAGIASVAVNFAALDDPATRVTIAHLLVDGLLVALFFSLVLEVSDGRRLDVAFDAFAAAGVATVLLASVALLVPFFAESEMNPVAFFGLFYYCRVQLAFHGPVHFSAFVAAVTPILVLAASRAGPGLWRRLCLASIWIAPVVVFAGGSRTVRIAFVLALLALAFHASVRRLTLSVCVFAIVLFVALFPFRCLTDVYVGGENMGGLLSAEEFFADAHRAELRADTLEALTGTVAEAIDTVDAGEDGRAAGALLRLLFGFGPGIPAYEAFGVGSHTAYIDVFVARGLVGTALIVGAALILASRIVRAAAAGPDRLRATAMLAVFAPIAAAAVSFDVSAWLFVWVFIALAVATTRVESRSRPNALPFERVS